MITQIADRISTFLFHGKIINSKDREKCRYGLEIMISTCIGFSVILLAGSILGKVQMALVYLICIVPLRMYTGGYHAETYLKCNFVFAVIFLLNIIVFDFIISHALQRELLMITFFSIFPINRYAPVENSNKKISITQKKKYKKISILMYGFYYMVSIMLLHHGNRYGVLVLLVLNTVTILLLEVKISEKVKSQNIGMYC